MSRIMCSTRQQLETRLNTARANKVAFDKLIVGSQQLDPAEQAEKDGVYSRYNSIVDEINQHESECAFTKCGCRD